MSPPQDRPDFNACPDWSDSAELPGYLRSLNRLRALYPDEATQDELASLIRLGDFCIRDDVANFVQNFNTLWSNDHEATIGKSAFLEMGSSVRDKLISSFRYTEFLAQRGLVWFGFIPTWLQPRTAQLCLE